MARLETGNPHDFESFDNLPSRERIRKPRRREVEARGTKLHHRTSLPSAPVKDVVTRDPLTRWPAFRNLLEGWRDPQQKDLLWAFAVSRGPDEVRDGLRKLNILTGMQTSREVPMQMRVQAFGFAMSSSFQRLAYETVDKREKGKIVTDVIESVTSFRELRSHGGSFFPQGMIIDATTTPPTLETLCLYCAGRLDRERLSSFL